MKLFMKYYGIYQIHNKNTNMNYYGSVQTTFQERKSTHWRQLKNNKHPNPDLQNSWNYYGEEAFEFIIILICDKHNCLFYEQLFLDKYWDGGVKCFNIAKDATAPMKGKKASPETKAKMSKSQKGRKHTQETKDKISRANKGKIRKRGYKRPPEVIDKVRKALTGKKRSPEACVNIGRAHIGKEPWNKGKKMDEAYSKRCGMGRKGKQNSPESKEKRRQALVGKKRGSMPEETKHKISVSKKGKPGTNKGKKASAEAKAKMSAAHMNHKQTDETKKKISEASKLMWQKRKEKNTNTDV